MGSEIANPSLIPSGGMARGDTPRASLVPGDQVKTELESDLDFSRKTPTLILPLSYFNFSVTKLPVS